MLRYYRDMFRVENLAYHPDCFQDMDKNLIKDQAKSIDKTFTQEEIYLAVENLKGNVAPGSDGFPASFYHNYYDIMG